MTRENALELLNQYVKNGNMLKHSYASEAVMRKLAERLNSDIEKWGLAGLLHDLDSELTGSDMKVHGLKTAEILEGLDLDPEIIDAIKMHNEDATGLERTTEFQHALAACETITGMITATALIYPDKKIASVKPKSVVKRMKSKAFAASVNRETIRECEKIGIPLNEFVEISLDAMKGISEVLGL